MSIKADEHSPIIYFDTDFNEELSADIINQALDIQIQRYPNQRIRLNLEGVTRGNSTGIYVFLKVLNEKNIPFSFVATPVWMVLQFNFLAGFLSKDVLVESIQAEYYCDTTNETEVFTVALGKDIPILPEYEAISFQYQTDDGRVFEANFSEDYLFFVTHWYDKLKRIENS